MTSFANQSFITSATTGLSPLPKLFGKPIAQLVFPFHPEPARRPRFSVQKVKLKTGQTVQQVVVKNSKAYDDYLYKLQQVLMCCRRPCPPDAILSVVSEFIFEVPKSWPLAKQEAHWGRPARMAHQGDSDNLQKPVCDALQEKGWLLNDAQVAAMFGVKRYQHSREETPRTIVTFLAAG